MNPRFGPALFLGALLLGLALCTCAEAESLDLLALHERALQSAPALRIAEAARAEQQARLQAANARLGPQLDALWQHGAGREGLAGRLNQGALQLNQALFDAPRWHSRDAARQRVAGSEAELLASQQQLRQTSARLFVQLHAQTQLQQVQGQLRQAFADEAQRMGVRHAQGLAAAVDWRQSQSFQLLAEASARGGAQQLRALRQSLVAHVGDVGLLDAAIKGLRADALPPALDAADSRSPQRDAQRAEIAARQGELAAARQAAWPTLSLQAQTQRDLQSRPANGSDWSLQLRIPLWDSGDRSAGRSRF